MRQGEIGAEELPRENKTDDIGTMTQSEKKAEILSVIKDLKNKWLYTLKLVEKFHEAGFDQIDAFSFYTNYICRKRLPNEKIKIDFLYDFTKDYTESTIGSEASEPKAVS